MLIFIFSLLLASLSYLTMDTPKFAFGLSWCGSIFLLYNTNRIFKSVNQSRKWFDIIMLPQYLPHYIFALFACVTSIFYFLDLNGYYFLQVKRSEMPIEKFRLLAWAQFYSYVFHIFYLLGVFALSKKSNYVYRYELKVINRPMFLFCTVLFAQILTILLAFIPGLNQFRAKFIDLSLVSSTLFLSISIIEKRKNFIFISIPIFAYYLSMALVSGWKEQVLVPLIMLSAFLYPTYKKIVLIISVPLFLSLTYVLPAFVETIRTLSWKNDYTAEIAAQKALENVTLQKAESLDKIYWGFLTGRLSEISLFCKYIDNVPKNRDYYNWKIVNQGILSLMPRIMYPSKPITEDLVMKRVFENNIVESISNVSAKPSLIVDGYISFGLLGVVCFAFLMGLSAALIAQKSFYLFNGYLWGICLIYTGLFQPYWKSNSFEFMLNSVFWSFVLMYILFYFGKFFGIIKKVKP